MDGGLEGVSGIDVPYVNVAAKAFVRACRLLDGCNFNDHISIEVVLPSWSVNMNVEHQFIGIFLSFCFCQWMKKWREART